MKTCRVFMFSLLFLCCTLTTFGQWTNIQNYLTTFDSVGIGVNVPRARLEVRGTGLISNSGYTVPPFNQEVSAVLQFHSAVNQVTVPPVTDYARNGRIWLDAKSKRFVMASESSDVPISFEIDSSERFRVMPDGIRISRNGSHPTDAYMLIQPDYNVAALNPGATPNAGRITNRYLGHLVFDIRANDAQDAFAIRTDRDLNGQVDHVALTVKPNAYTGFGTSKPSGPLHVLTAGAPPGGLPSDQNGLLLGIQSTAGYKWIQSYGNILSLNPRGNAVAVGTTSVPSGYRFAVDGKIIGEEVKVQLSQDWPDYVFAQDYQLMPLETLEASIKKHGHLPGMPSAKEVEAAGGIALGEMQRKLLEKLEELTLYVIELKKDNQDLREQVEVLKK